MIAQEVAHKYARALFMSVKDRGLVDEAYQQFQALRQVTQTDPDLISLLAGPGLPEQEKLDLVQRVFGDRMHRLHVEFLAVLIRKRRISYLPEVIDELEHLIEEEKGISRASVISAVEVSPEDEAHLVRQLETKTGHTVLLERKVDRNMIGGAIVMLRNEIIDGSVRHALDQLEEQLLKLRVH